MRDAALNRAIEEAGGTSKLARIVGVKPQAVSQWRRIPVARVAAISEALNIPRHELRPDIFPAPEGK